MNNIKSRLNRSDIYTLYVQFQTSKTKNIIPYYIFLLAAIIAFLVANFPSDRTSSFLSETFKNRLFLKSLLTNIFTEYGSKPSDYNNIGSNLISSIKNFLFFIAFLILAYPILISLSKSKLFWHKLGLKKIALSALGIFLVLSLLAFPYGYPYGLNSHPSGLSGIGKDYGKMSLAPFAANNELIYRRLLKPALAHFIQMDGYILYYLFSLICTYILIFMTIGFIESKILGSNTFEENKRKSLSSTVKFFVYLSVMTSSYMMVNFQWPGYPDQLAFILILVMACIPMTRQGRLGTIALCLLTHDGITFALIPIILFCFPQREKSRALLLVALFYAIWFASYGFNLHQGLAAHQAVGGEQSNWQVLNKNRGLALAGVFFSYKLFWLVFLYTVGRLWFQKDKATLVAIVSIILFPAFIILLAWDTSRLMGFGFFGMLIALGILIHEYRKLPAKHSYLLMQIMYVNILIPSSNILLVYQDSLSNYPYPGLYMLIHRIFHSFLT